MKNNLDIDSRQIYITRAHRLGRRNMSNSNKNRPIIANFRDYGTVELIMGNVRRLRNTSFSVDYDFPREIQEARSRLWPKYKTLKQQNPKSKVHIVYPAKLIQDGTVIQDEMPEWGKYIGANRLANVDNIGTIKRPQFGCNDGLRPELTTHQQQQQRNGHNQGDITNTRTLPRPVHMSSEGIYRQSQQHVETMELQVTLSQNPVLSTHEVSQKPPLLINGLPPLKSEYFTAEQSTCLTTATLKMNNEQSKCTSITNPSDDTLIKSVACDAINPNINLIAKTPARGRPRDPRSLTLTRAEKRSQSAKPYNRQGSKSRECSLNRQQGLTASTINNAPVCNSTTHEDEVGVGGAQGQGQPSTGSVIK